MYAQIFEYANAVAMLAWVLLIAAPHWSWTERIARGIIVVGLAALYVYFVLGAIKMDDFASFGSLHGVMQLFTSEQAVLAGWLHYLAFDLMTGLYIKNDAQKYEINHFIIVPCLLLTFMLGPTGLLLYFLVRLVKTKAWFL
jgi:hypothetical protein